jgi:hypothetical protein
MVLPSVGISPVRQNHRIIRVDRFGHGGLSRFGFERCHGSSGAVRTVCVLAGAALVQSPVVRA